MIHSRKFVVAIVALFISALVIFFGAPSLAEKAMDTLIWIVGTYVGANAIEDSAKALSSTYNINKDDRK